MSDKEMYNDLDDFDDYNPYENYGWSGLSWFCIRCGSELKTLERTNWKHMKKHGSLLFLCSNKECFHNSAPLVLHHPDSDKRGPGESYSVSWIR